MTEMSRSAAGIAVGMKPHVDSIIPAHGPAEGGEMVVLTGTGLGDVKRVVFCGQDATDVDAQPTRVTCIAPQVEPGPCDVHVITRDGTRSNVVKRTGE